MSPAADASSDLCAPLVLVFGDDDFEVRSQVSLVMARWAQELPDVEPEFVDGNASNVKEVADAINQLKLGLETLSLFGSGKVVWFRNCNFLAAEGRVAQASSTADAVEGLLELLKGMDWGQTRLLISASGVDKRKRFYKWFQKNGSVQACQSLEAQGERGVGLAVELVSRAITQSGKRIAPRTVDTFVEWVGLDRRALMSEIEKAILHSGDQDEVTLDDVEATVTKNRQAKAFAFADAVADRKLAVALSRLDEELWSMRTDRQKSEMGLLYGLISKFRNMLMVKDLVVRGRLREERSFGAVKSQLSSLRGDEFPEDRRFNPLGQNPYVIFRTLLQVKNYRQRELVDALAMLMDCNVRLVSAGDNPGSVLRDCIIGIILGRQSS